MFNPRVLQKAAGFPWEYRPGNALHESFGPEAGFLVSVSARVFGVGVLGSPATSREVPDQKKG